MFGFKKYGGMWIEGVLFNLNAFFAYSPNFLSLWAWHFLWSKKMNFLPIFEKHTLSRCTPVCLSLCVCVCVCVCERESVCVFTQTIEFSFSQFSPVSFLPSSTSLCFSSPGVQSDNHFRRCCCCCCCCCCSNPLSHVQLRRRRRGKNLLIVLKNKKTSRWQFSLRRI